MVSGITSGAILASVTMVKGKWRALVRRKGYKQQCKTFPVKAAADAWARGVERDMDLSVFETKQSGALTVSAVIQAYRKLRERTRPSVTARPLAYQ